MKAFNVYHICRPSFARLQPLLVDAIIKAAHPDAIYLLGATLHRRRTESIFSQSAPTSQHIAGCCLLVLVNKEQTQPLHRWQDAIESACSQLLTVTAIVLHGSTFSEWLQQGHRFAVQVVQKAPELYSSGTVSLQMPKGIAQAVDNASVHKQYISGKQAASAFLSASELLQQRKQFALSAFMLHQAAEQALRTIIKYGTGYHECTHNLKKLLSYCSLVSWQLPDIFNTNRIEDRRLLTLLQKAYIDGRYNVDFAVGEGDVVLLIAKVKRLIELRASPDRRPMTWDRAAAVWSAERA